MSRLFTVILFLALSGSMLKAQNVGVSVSFFFPKGGEFSIPVSPLSYRGVALPFSDYIGIQTGGTLYRMGGQQISGLPFESNKPMFGNNLTAFVPLELYFKVGNKKSAFTMKAGVFGVYSFFTRLNYGNIDRAIRVYEGWEVANADFTYKYLPGWGYQGGIELLYYVKRNLGLTLEINYLYGGSNIDLAGSYTGGNAGVFQTVQLDPASYQKGKVEFTGLEISLGAIFGN
ncbi:MAG: hypothetical protein OEW75_01025 [Cyclobacteriaceae bacterium]|nr:hypothetical protein [Cyclobacteriaceae bacterium]